MSKISYLETIKEIKDGVKQKSFSQKDLKRLAVAYLNDPAHTFTDVTEKKGEIVKTEVKPVQGFYDFITKVLKDAGVEDADAFLAEYTFKTSQVDFMYDFVTEFVHGYLSTGRKLKLFSREDIDASIALTDRAEATKKTIDKEGKESFTKIKTHKGISQSSGCPSWLKYASDKKGKKI